MRRRNRFLMAAVLAAVFALAIAVPASAATVTDPPASTETTTCAPGQGGPFGVGGRMSAAVSQLLGMEVSDLEAARQAGQSLAQIAQSKDVSNDELLGTMLEVRKAALAEAVATGRITQERADVMLERMSARLSDRINETDVGPFGGRGQGGRGHCSPTQ